MTIESKFNRHSLELQVLAGVGRPASTVSVIRVFRGSGVEISGVFAGEVRSMVVNIKNNRVTVNESGADKRESITASIAVGASGLVVLTDVIVPIGAGE